MVVCVFFSLFVFCLLVVDAFDLRKGCMLWRNGFGSIAEKNKCLNIYLFVIFLSFLICLVISTSLLISWVERFLCHVC